MIVTVENTVRAFLLEILIELSSKYNLTLVVNTSAPDLLEEALGGKVRVVPLALNRGPAPFHDLLMTYRLFLLFRRERFALVHTISPKAGLLGMTAAWLARTPIRLHTFQGEVWVTRHGIWRYILKSIDRLVGWCSTDATVVSHSERDFLVGQGMLREERSIVLANGSISGVDTERFSPDIEARSFLRAKHGATDSNVVFLYIGRLNRDKGIPELAESFALLATQESNAHLWIVGPDEEGMLDLVAETLAPCRNRVHVEPFVNCPENFMAAADILILASHREGFGVVIIEAAACGIPAIASRVYGVTDAVEEGVTGLLFPVGDALALRDCMANLGGDASLRASMSKAGRDRVCMNFEKTDVCGALVEYYATLLHR